jgi:arylsulfatase
VESEIEMSSGSNDLDVWVTRQSKSTGQIEISVNGTPSGSIELPFLMGMISSIGASVGRDTGSPVSPRYESPFEFTGDLREVTIQLGLRTQQEDEVNGKAEMSRQ